MARPSSFLKTIVRDKGVFNGRNFSISTDSVTWIHIYGLFITNDGSLYSTDENDNNYLLLANLQSCFVQVVPNINQSAQANATRKKLPRRHSDPFASDEHPPPVVYIRTYENEKLYIKIPSKNNFGYLLSALVVWQNLKPEGLVKKWYAANRFDAVASSAAAQPHEVLVCRFKVYGPIPHKNKALNIVKGPRVPDSVRNSDSKLDHDSGPGAISQGASQPVNEGWFYTMGVLRSNGLLNFITELDGTLLYSIDVKTLMSSEIREVHHSIFDNSNMLFLGQIKELRWNNLIKTVSCAASDHVYSSFLTKEGKPLASGNRVFIEFPLHIDLEDWFVGLNYFAKREYIGSFNPHATVTQSIAQAEELSNVNKSSEDLSFSLADTSGSFQPSTSQRAHLDSPLKLFEKDSFRVSKKVSIDIVEAKFDNAIKPAASKVYAEVVMWGLAWSRTAPVPLTANPFWKEDFSTDLPISTQIIHILIKQTSRVDSIYAHGDKVIGTVYITPDILNKDASSTTMILENNKGNTINVQGNRAETPPILNDIVRLAIYDSSNLPIGKLLINVSLKEYHILSPKNFKPFENMLVNAPLKDLIGYFNDNVSTSEFENVSLVMLDIFQSLGVEDKWFKALMESELVNVDIMTRKNYANNRSSIPSANVASSSNVFNTLFRGSSIFSKSLEKYNLRIGQEYLEKVFGDFFERISKEKLNCEVDPRYVRLQEKAERKGIDIDDLDDDEEDADYDSDQEEAIDKRVQMMVGENLSNLRNYCEMIWNKIYTTSNDLPDQIKLQLKNFRAKVELACDPSDKVTALNCLSAFIFLRFFCPAILNPKLFYLTKHHQTGRSQRTLTLIAKLLLNLANRQEFLAHKEPHLIKMNAFIESHKDDVIDYFDKITGRKNDFNEKVLDLSHEVKRFDLGFSNDSFSSELPTTPYLIDKCLRLTELMYLLDSKEFSVDEKEKAPGGNSEKQSSRLDSSEDNFDSSDNEVILNPGRGGARKILHPREAELLKDDVYKIGSLEFEKSEFLDLAGEDDTGSFIKSLCRSDENIFSFITSNITLKDLMKRSSTLRAKVSEIERLLQNNEYPTNYQSDHVVWESFVQEALSRSYVDLHRNCLVQVDAKELVIPNHYKKLNENGLGSLKLKFSDDANEIADTPARSSMAHSSSEHSLRGSIKPSSRNPFKKWLRKA